MSGKRQLLIVEDDEAFARTLKRSFERRDYDVRVAHSPEELTHVLEEYRPGYAVVDLKLGAASGLACVQTLRAADAAMRIVVLTGYGAIATAVAVILAEAVFATAAVAGVVIVFRSIPFNGGRYIFNAFFSAWSESRHVAFCIRDHLI